jgi:hypothetical protein
MHSIGKQALYAFEAADGTITLGTREEVSTWLQSRVTELQTTPFVLHDVAEFLGDSGLLSEAQTRCDMLLQRSRETTSLLPTGGTTRAIQWEYDLVEKPFCKQLQTMGWQWLEGDTDVPDFTERGSFREVLLKERLAAALRKLNLRDGQPWLDETRIARAIHDLEQAPGIGSWWSTSRRLSCCLRVRLPMVCLTGSRLGSSRCGSLISRTRQTTISSLSTSSRWS